MYYSGNSQYDQLSVPLTPLDLTYSQSMIPSNLLVGSPYFINSFPVSPQLHSQQLHHHHQGQAAAQAQSQAQLHAAHAHAQAQAQAHAIHNAQVSPFNNSRQYQHPYGQNYHNNSGSQTFGPIPGNNSTSSGLSYKFETSNLDSLCLSRTIVLKNLLEDLTLEQVLNVIDFGPIEYVRIFKKPAPSHLEDTQFTQTCHISFLNSKISINFHLKYAKNKYNLNKLKQQLDSKNLKIVLNERLSNPNSSASGKLDFIKLKTLNYVMDLKATRSINLKARELNEAEIREQLEKFGAIEKWEVKLNAQSDIEEPEIQPEAQLVGDLESKSPEIVEKSTNEEPAEDESTPEPQKDDILPEKSENAEEGGVEAESEAKTAASEADSTISITVHYTSIDAAIKCYDFYVKKIQNSGADSDVKSISFAKDRCDKSPVESIATSQPPTANSTTASSPVISRRNTTSHSNFLPNESIISIPEDDSYGSEGSEFSEFNPLMILENNESIRKSLIKRNEEVSSPSSSSGEGEIDGAERIHRSSNSHSTMSQSNRSHSHMSQSNISALSMPLSSMSLPMIPPSPNMHHHPHMHHQFPGYSNIPDQFNNVGNRTIYLGNLHPNTTVEDIANNVRAGGIVQSIKYHHEKKACFITFVDPLIALKFFLNHEVLHQLVIHGYDVTVGWAKNHSGPLSRDITLAVTAGASRNVYIGIKPTGHANEDDLEGQSAKKEPLPDEEILRRDFSKFGELEQINFYHNKDCGFLNFLNIADAIKLVDCFGMKNVEKVNKIVGDSGEFYEKYSQFKISFAKDRCGNPPKFSIRKKVRGQKKTRSNMSSTTNLNGFGEGDLYESDIVNELRESSRLEEAERKKRDDSGDKEATEYKPLESNVERSEMTEEAAMVFGIISKKDDEEEEKEKEKETEVREKEEQPVVVGAPIEVGEENEVEQENKNSPLKEVAAVDNSAEDDDEEDEDEVSIIINSEDISTSSIISDKSSPLKTPSKPPKGTRGVRRSNSDLFTPKRNEYSRNSSNISLNSSYSKNGYYNNPLKQAPLPQQIYQQPGLYYMSPQRASPSGLARNGAGSVSGSISGSGPNGGYFNFHPASPTPQTIPYGHGQYGAPALPHPQAYHHLHQVNMLAYGPPSPYYAPHYSSQPHLPSSSSTSGRGYGTSGSQVMAQYLAQSQHENILYAAAIYNNGLENEDESFHFKGRRRQGRP